jgi:hypothetical protein
MANEPTAVSRLVTGSTAFNTINLPTVELVFQRAPGNKPGRGIEALDFRVVKEGRVIQTGSTGADGTVAMLLPGGAARLELLVRGSVVASYDVVLQTAGVAPVETKAGQLQRLRILGYHVGHGGPLKDGVTDDEIPIGKIKNRSEGESFERSLLDFQADIGSLPGNSTVVGPLVAESGV